MPSNTPSGIECIVFDFANTLCSERYFSILLPAQRQMVEEDFFEDPVSDRWFKGDLTSVEVARLLSPRVELPADKLHDSLIAGCREMRFNSAIWRFARTQHAQGKKTALVTVNSDVFSDVVVPSHHLHEHFDSIVNSSDHHSLDKLDLWPIAFKAIGGGIGYENSFLFDDRETNVVKFREKGGGAYQYHDEIGFIRWVGENLIL